MKRKFALGALAAAVVAATAALIAIAVPYPVERLAPAASLRVVDRSGQLLREVEADRGGRRDWISLDQVPEALLLATLAGEDRGFYEHRGVEVGALLRAAWLDLRAGKLAFGGSTITMQLARLVEPHRHGIWAKVSQIFEALRIERALDKRAILEQYVNRAYYGHRAYGIEAAARRYFGRSARSLSDGQATLLAVLPRGPALYDPIEHLDRAVARRRHLLSLMVAAGFFDAARAARAGSEPLSLQSREVPDTEAGAFRAPHFVDWALSGMSPAERRTGGVVRTTLEGPLQARVEQLVVEHVRERVGDRVHEAGVVVLDSRTGAVLAMVGSPDYSAPAGQVNITTTPRHPGSSLKPFVYALALEAGDSPASIAWDVNDPKSRYQPRNADGRQHGPVRYRVALASSYNLAAVHTLERVGVGRLLGRLRDAGLSTLDRTEEDYGPALALGSGPVRLVDLAAAYGFLVNEGEVARPFGVHRLDRPGGRPEVRATSQPRQIFTPQVAWLTMDMLSDPEARRPAFGDDLPFDLPFRVAAKTGTSGGFSDNVAVIATREITVAAWAGNFDGRPMHEVLAMWSAAPLARAALLAAADGRRLTLPPRPAALVQRPVCTLSGEAPGPTCPLKREWFIAGAEPVRSQPCSWHQTSEGRTSVAWPAPARPWAASRTRAGRATRSLTTNR